MLIFREPHLAHFPRLPISGTGVSPGSGTFAGFTSTASVTLLAGLAATVTAIDP